MYAKKLDAITGRWSILDVTTGRTIATYTRRADAENALHRCNRIEALRAAYLAEFNNPTLTLAA